MFIFVKTAVKTLYEYTNQQQTKYYFFYIIYYIYKK